MLYSNRDLRNLFVPLVLEQLLTGFVGAVDTMMVTRVGDTAISAVSCVDTVNTLMIYIFAALAAGGTIICSQYLGQKNTESACSAAEQVYLSAFVLSMGLMLICVSLCSRILNLIFGSVEAAIMEQAVVYFRITAFAYPFMALQQVSAALFRAEGNSKFPMAVTGFSNLINIGGNAVLIFGFGLGVTGAAVSTLLCRIAAAVILLWEQRKPKHVIRVDHMLSIRPQRAAIRMVLRVGIPTAVENSLFQFGKLAVQSTVSTLGTTAIAAQAMTNMLDLFQSYAGQAVGLGVLTVIGTCIGAGETEQARMYTRKLMLLCECMLLASGAGILLIARPIMWISGLSAEASALSFRLMIAIVLVRAVLWAAAFTLPNTLRAAGDVRFTTAVSGASMWLFRVGLSWVLCRYCGFGLEGVWIGWFADWLVRACFYVTRYRSGKWLQKSVLQ